MHRKIDPPDGQYRDNHPRRRPAGLLMAGLLLVLVLAGCTDLQLPIPWGTEPAPEGEAERFAPPTMTPGPVPATQLQMLGTEEEVNLERWRGQGIILNFWATWCYPCRQEMPILAAIHDKYDDIVVVGVNHMESASKAQGYVDELGLSFPILLDRDGTMSDELNIVALPTTFFINSEGKIIGSHLGPVTTEMLEEVVPQLRSP